MADRLSITASIIAAMQLSIKVARYVRDVTDATGYRNTLLLEMGATKGILGLPWNVGQGATHDADTMANTRMLEEPLKNYAALLTRLEGVSRPGERAQESGQDDQMAAEEGGDAGDHRGYGAIQESPWTGTACRPYWIISCGPERAGTGSMSFRPPKQSVPTRTHM